MCSKRRGPLRSSYGKGHDPDKNRLLVIYFNESQEIIIVSRCNLAKAWQQLPCLNKEAQ
jgi:hypothetical protein